MRLFAALLPPPAVTEQLAAGVRELRRLPEADRLRWTERSGWHVTLAFYGDVPEATLPRIEEGLARAASGCAPLELRIVGGGRFGYRALWAGVRGEHRSTLSELRRLAAESSAVGRHAGLETEDLEHRPYRPHLTLGLTGRAHPPADLPAFVTALAAFRSPPWTADELALVRSHPPTSGVLRERPRYETLTTWPLTPA
ncbi:RNA 2',3'-cyclic phosphodiesterase [Streptomyces sp. AJS327]|uniref:RNA 2',3'-cyclic phosphodiesterase n=1 Tax=Streptomyces sp. AJS327 TaxID=2545265 RepID=UPI0015E004A1|nr:RNA 2',3'-cyclic phosphodiesterase [Streptomyces sp. AJS327]MBA0053238.1 RNA 2',3'-cyclic phosphodiesterase [Streptomyces sp. AJS327]